MAKTTPTQRTLAELTRRGWTKQVVEKWNPHARVRQDLFGVIDVLAIDDDSDHKQWLGRSAFVGIQACAGSSHATRRAKILAEPRAKQWLYAGGRLEIWSFSKTGPRGKRKTWQLRVESITVDMFADTVRREQG